MNRFLQWNQNEFATWRIYRIYIRDRTTRSLYQLKSENIFQVCAQGVKLRLSCRIIVQNQPTSPLMRTWRIFYWHATGYCTNVYSKWPTTHDKSNKRYNTSAEIILNALHIYTSSRPQWCIGVRRAGERSIGLKNGIICKNKAPLCIKLQRDLYLGTDS